MQYFDIERPINFEKLFKLIKIVDFSSFTNDKDVYQMIRAEISYFDNKKYIKATNQNLDTLLEFLQTYVISKIGQEEYNSEKWKKLIQQEILRQYREKTNVDKLCKLVEDYTKKQLESFQLFVVVQDASRQYSTPKLFYQFIRDYRSQMFKSFRDDLPKVEGDRISVIIYESFYESYIQQTNMKFLRSLRNFQQKQYDQGKETSLQLIITILLLSQGVDNVLPKYILDCINLIYLKSKIKLCKHISEKLAIYFKDYKLPTQQFQNEFDFLIEGKQSNQEFTTDQLNLIYSAIVWLYMICHDINLIRVSNDSTYQLNLINWRPHERTALKYLIRQISDGSLGYRNIQVVEQLDQFFAQLTSQYFEKISKNRNSENIIIDVQSLVNFQIQQFSEFGEPISNQEYFESHNPLQKMRQYCINSKNPEELKDIQNYFNSQIAQIQQSHKEKQRIEKMLIHKVAGKESKLVNLCISGFTSEDEDKIVKWQNLFKQDEEIFALQWPCKSYSDLRKDLILYTGKLGLLKTVIRRVTIGFSFTLTLLEQLIHNPSFQEAYNNAILAGKYLAWLLAESRVFEGCMVNLIGFSLGTLVIQSCLEELDKIYDYTGFQVNNVILMGGVADLNKWQDMSLISVGGSIRNVYCENDYMLKYFLRMQKWSIVPCGFYPIINTIKKITNFNATYFIDGHLKYEEQFTLILEYQDLNGLLEFHEDDTI